MLQVLVLSSIQNSRNYNPRRCSPRCSSNQRPGGHVLHFTTEAAADTKTPGRGFFFFSKRRENCIQSEPSPSMLYRVSSSGPTPAQLFLTGAQPWGISTMASFCPPLPLSVPLSSSKLRTQQSSPLQ